MKVLSILVLLWAVPCLAHSWQESLLKLLPERINSIVIHQTTLDEIKKKLGEPALVKNDSYYWIYQGFEYALELKVKNNIIRSLHFRFPQTGPSVDALKLDPKNFKESKIATSRYMDYHDVGGSISIDLASQTVTTIRIK